MEGISETTLLTFLGGQGLHRLQVEVVIQVQEVQVLTSTSTSNDREMSVGKQANSGDKRCRSNNFGVTNNV